MRDHRLRRRAPAEARIARDCRRLKEAINECTSALDLDPSFAKALIRRAKAHEAMGHYKQALSDIQKANKADSANPDTQVRALLLRLASRIASVSRHELHPSPEWRGSCSSGSCWQLRGAVCLVHRRPRSG